MTVIRSDGAEFCVFARDLLRDGIIVRYRADGGSMFPFIRSDDILSVSPTDVGQVQIGDVLLCESIQGTLLAHRLVGKGIEGGKAALVTRGDALSYADPPLDAEALLGRVTRIERQGCYISLTGHWARLQGRLLASFPFAVRRLVSFLVRATYKLSAIRICRLFALRGTSSSCSVEQ